MKSAWKKPELIVLVRTQPEEAVLNTCKQTDTLGVGANRRVCVGEGGVPDCNPLTCS